MSEVFTRSDSGWKSSNVEGQSPEMFEVIHSKEYPPFSIIAGYRYSDRAIGKNGQLPWKIPKDMLFFRKTTQSPFNGKKNILIMGRKTFNSLNCTPLIGRINIVCTREEMMDIPDIQLYFVKTFEDALLKFAHAPNIHKTFVIGGEALYSYAIQHSACHEIIINEFWPCIAKGVLGNDDSHKCLKPSRGFDIDSIVCDCFFPEIDSTNYELVLDYNSIDSNERIEVETLQDSSLAEYIKIRYKRYVKKLT